jgi:hypothetical protein
LLSTPRFAAHRTWSRPKDEAEAIAEAAELFNIPPERQNRIIVRRLGKAEKGGPSRLHSLERAVELRHDLRRERRVVSRLMREQRDDGREFGLGDEEAVHRIGAWCRLLLHDVSLWSFSSFRIVRAGAPAFREPGDFQRASPLVGLGDELVGVERHVLFDGVIAVLPDGDQAVRAWA